MKRFILLTLIVFTLCAFTTAFAEVPQLSDTLMSDAKQAIVYMVSGEYERLVTLFPFSGVSPSASEWESFFTGNFDSVSDKAQTDYAVAYWTGYAWEIAVPVDVPSDENVETLVLSSSDGVSFSAYRFSKWGDVKEKYESAEYLNWKDEYVEMTPVISVD
ncbi:MAG: hypothetical protein U0L09_08345 [Christensenellales bacterium]|nr:hypothetical protein [Christensenellales bacterium]